MALRCSFKWLHIVILFFVLSATSNLNARRFTLPDSNDNLLGEVFLIHTAHGDTPASISQRYNVGINAILAANPGTTAQTIFNNGASITVPATFLLPSLPRKGIVINLPEMRLYYYLPDSDQLMTFPIGIGRIGNTIPIIRTRIVRKVKDPIWIPPNSIREYNEQRGITLPKVMPAGPDNPLGPYAIYLKLPTYLIHSTPFSDSIGRRASFGCIRMNERDIVQFFPIVTAGTPVEIIDMPNKVAWVGRELYLEAHPPLAERSQHNSVSLEGLITKVEQSLPKDPESVTLVNWQLIATLANRPDGMPHPVGMQLR